MGDYLSKPNTEKHSEDGKNDSLAYGASCMQGWRTSQEDAHNCILDYDEGRMALFAVYDGHGGHEVAEYCSKYLPDYIKKTDSFKSGNYPEALITGFLEFDDRLVADQDVVNELNLIADGNYVPGGKKEKGQDLDEDEIDDPSKPTCSSRISLAEVLKADELHSSTEERNNIIKEIPKAEKPRLTNGDVEIKKANNAGEEVDCAKSVADERALEKEIVSDIEEHVTKPMQTIEIEKEAAISSGEQTLKKIGTNVDQNQEASGMGQSSSGCNEADENLSSSVSGSVDNEGEESEDDPWSRFKKKLLNRDDNEDESDSSSDSDTEEASANISDTTGDEDSSSAAADASDDDDDDETESAEGEDVGEEEEMYDVLEPGDVLASLRSLRRSRRNNSVNVKVRHEPGKDSGCTACMALVLGDCIYVANTGDSRCIGSKNGTAIDFSIDHKPEDDIEKERIYKAGGYINAGRICDGLNVSRTIGDHTFKCNQSLVNKDQMITALPDVKKFDITPDLEFIVVACDGIWNSFSSQEVVDFIRPKLKEGVKISDICEQMFDAILAPDTYSNEGEGCDNMTCIIVQFLKASSKKRELSQERTEFEGDDAKCEKKIKIDDFPTLQENVDGKQKDSGSVDA